MTMLTVDLKRMRGKRKEEKKFKRCRNEIKNAGQDKSKKHN